MRPFDVSAGLTINLDAVASWRWGRHEPKMLIVRLMIGDTIELDEATGNEFLAAVGAMATSNYFGWDHPPPRSERHGYS